MVTPAIRLQHTRSQPLTCSHADGRQLWPQNGKSATNVQLRPAVRSAGRRHAQSRMCLLAQQSTLASTIHGATPGNWIWTTAVAISSSTTGSSLRVPRHWESTTTMLTQLMSATDSASRTQTARNSICTLQSILETQNALCTAVAASSPQTQPTSSATCRPCMRSKAQRAWSASRRRSTMPTSTSEKSAMAWTTPHAHLQTTATAANTTPG